MPTIPNSSLRSMTLILWKHRQLIRAFAAREISARYRGSFLGLLWSFFTPFLMLGVYTFVFGFVYNARWGGLDDGNRFQFAMILFSGLIVFNLFAECMNRAPSLILGHATYVKKVVFPLEILPCAVLFAALFHALVSFAVLFAALSLIQGIPITALWLPVVLAPLLLVLLGLSWFLSSLGVYVRDVGHVMAMVVTVCLFFSPVFYPVSALPRFWQYILYCNPLTFIIEQVRLVLLDGHMPVFSLLAPYSLLAAVIAWAGFAWFQKTRQGFADVI